MSVFRSGPALRRLVPSAAAVVVLGGGAAAGTIVARADPSLPYRSAAQLLVDLRDAEPAGLSGTVVVSADLGLPLISGLVKGSGGASALAGLVAGTSTARVWQTGADRARLAVLGTSGETDVLRAGPDLWLWSSTDRMASHLVLPAGPGPLTPPETADAALAAIGPGTGVETGGTTEVAGRPAYELVLTPRDPASLIGQVRLAIDAGTHIPLRVDVYPRNAAAPAVRVAFQQISFTVPDEEQYVFNPPPGTTVAEGDAGAAGSPTVAGQGWTPVVKSRQHLRPAALGTLPEVSGPWGTGRLLTGTLFTALITDDGWVFAGPVTPAKLYEVAGG